GVPSGIVDVDLDCELARRLAPFVLTSNQPAVFGRQSAPDSHWIFRTDTALPVAQLPYRDLDGAMLLELRGTGGQTMFPPSIHPNGEPLSWSQPPAEGLPVAPLDAIRQDALALAIVCLLAPHWPSEGSRHLAHLALAGGLLRVEWCLVDVQRL